MTEFNTSNPNRLRSFDRRRCLLLLGGAGFAAIGGLAAACGAKETGRPRPLPSMSEGAAATDEMFTPIIDAQGQRLDEGAATRVFPGAGVNRLGLPEILRPVFRVETEIPGQIGRLAAVAVCEAGLVQELGGLELEFWVRRGRLASTPLEHMRAFDPAEHVRDNPAYRELIYMQGVTVGGPLEVDVPVSTGTDTQELRRVSGITFDEASAGRVVRVEEAFSYGAMALRLPPMTQDAARYVTEGMTPLSPQEVPLVGS